MLYVGKCKCGFQVHSKDCLAFKTLMAQHLNTSHSGDYVFVASIPINDFKDDFLIDRVKDAEVIKILEAVFGNKGYWKAIRSHPALQNIPFSGLGGGENSLSEILRLHSARG